MRETLVVEMHLLNSPRWRLRRRRTLQTICCRLKLLKSSSLPQKHTKHRHIFRRWSSSSPTPLSPSPLSGLALILIRILLLSGLRGEKLFGQVTGVPPRGTTIELDLEVVIPRVLFSHSPEFHHQASITTDCLLAAVTFVYTSHRHFLVIFISLIPLSGKHLHTRIPPLYTGVCIGSSRKTRCRRLQHFSKTRVISSPEFV